ncbi:MAG: apolipoprotein N-acyltransferase [Actinomycetota bacterium]|nr:apolipoprotein N-acyltransferase [Actinomycetota bacterium]
MPRRPSLPSKHSLYAVLGGLMVAAALPPWGIWPLAFFGIALYETAAHAASTRRQRLARGWLFGAAWLFPGMCWMWFLTIPGYIIAAIMFACLHALAALVAPRGPWRVVGRPAAHTLVEALRFSFPFGGVPLASLPIGQAAGPFADVVRVGGVVLLTWFVFQVGFALAGPSPVVPAMVRKRGVTSRGEWHGVTGFLAALVVLLVLAPLADGGAAANHRSLRVAAVQGGGPQGTHATDTSAEDVLQRHLAATATIEPGSVDLVVWPENVIDVLEFEGSRELGLVAAEAARIGAPLAVGVTEDTADGTQFINAQVVVTPEGEVYSRYEKVRRVPFGEYMPLRGLLHALGAPTDLVPRDAVAGTGPAVLTLPDGTRMSTVISWEVFFGGRANEGVEAGGQFIINPTNGSSYTWTVLQTQQVASSRLRAIEQNRWVVQASPTGFTAFISPEGDVYQRTSVSEQEVITRTIELHSMRTWYSHTGDAPWIVLMVLLFAGSWFVPGRAWLQARRAAAGALVESPIAGPKESSAGQLDGGADAGGGA